MGAWGTRLTARRGASSLTGLIQSLTRENVKWRGWQLFMCLPVWLATKFVLVAVHAPIWLLVWFPLPAIALAVDALGPHPLFLRGTRKPLLPVLLALQAIFLALSVILAVAAVQSPKPRSDEPITLKCASQDVLRGVDPYSTFEPQCEASLGLNGRYATPLTNGPFASDHRYPQERQIRAAMQADERTGSHSGFPAYGYPPEAALLLLPVAFVGWSATSAWVALVTAMLLAVTWGGRTRAPSVLVVTQVSGFALMWGSFGWNPELIAYAALGLSFARIDRRRGSAAAMALAVLTNPLAWLAAPVYLSLTSKLPAWRDRMAFLALSLAVGTIPWLVWDPRLPTELWHFISAPEFPLGAAVGALFSVPSPMHWVLTGTFGLTIAGCTYIAWRAPSWGLAMAVAVLAAFLVSWRGLLFYYDAIFWLSPTILAGAFRLGPFAAPQRGSPLRAAVGP